jgi:hypothetical protein
MRRNLRVLNDWKWVIVRAVLWIGTTVLLAVQGKWLAAAVAFVVLGGTFFISGTTLLLIWRRQRHRERETHQARP